LRTKLVAGLLALLTAVCLVFGAVTEFALRAFLIGQLDHQLNSAVGHSENLLEQRPGSFPEEMATSNPGFLLAPGQYPGTVGAWLVDGRLRESGMIVLAGFDRPDGGPGPQGPPDSIVPLSSSDESSLASVRPDGHPTSQVLVAGDYRVIAVRTGGGGVLVMGLSMAEVEGTLLTVGCILCGLTLLGVVGAGAAGAALVRRALRPLWRVAATARKVSDTRLDRGHVALSARVPVSDTNPHTEVGQVGLALNHMLGHVAGALAVRHDSEVRVRQFVADASHELRTPLAAIRGYAEITRRSAESVPPDITYALSRIESESHRMTLLVEDLLLLARLDSGRPLGREVVDVSRLVVDVVNDAHMAGPGHQWRLDLPGEPITTVGDTYRLHQVLVNLLGNARIHTPPATTVTTQVRAENERVVLTVADDGPGIPSDLLPQVFERFSRGDNSRSQEAGSSGLGLAIVMAVVSAHGGEVSVESQPGRTAFTVSLPSVLPDPDEPLKMSR
jgi:two-component system OmpR family sensor kinase